MHSLKALVSTFKLHLSQSFSRPTFRFCILFQPLIFTFILYMMYKDSGHPHFVNYVIMGSGISSLWSSICFSSAGDIERERFMGTLEYLFCSPSSFIVIVLGKVLANTFLGLSGMVLSLVFAKVFFNQTLYVRHGFLFIGCFALTIFAFTCIALVIAPIFTLSKNARALMNCLEYPIFILCGFVFPISMLPSAVRPISYVLSPTWAVKLLRDSSLGISNFAAFYWEAGILMAICLVYILISHILFLRIDKLTRIKATLGVS